MLRISVTDTGLGLPPEAAAQLFEPFSLGDNSYARRHDGAGLGLAVAKRTVDISRRRDRLRKRSRARARRSGSRCRPSVSPRPSGPKPRRSPPMPRRPPGSPSSSSLTEPVVRAQISDLLEPFGNRLVFAPDRQRRDRAGRSRQISTPSSSAAAMPTCWPARPGVKAPLLAILTGGMRMPVAAGEVLALARLGRRALCGAGRSAGPRRRHHAAVTSDVDSDNAAAIDAPAFAALEKSLGLTTLIEILQSYMKTAEELSLRLEEAGKADQWDDATRIAQDIAGAAGGLGLTALTAAARGFTQKVREGEAGDGLRGAVENDGRRAQARAPRAGQPLSRSGGLTELPLPIPAASAHDRPMPPESAPPSHPPRRRARHRARAGARAGRRRGRGARWHGAPCRAGRSARRLPLRQCAGRPCAVRGRPAEGSRPRARCSTCWSSSPSSARRSPASRARWAWRGRLVLPAAARPRGPGAAPCSTRPARCLPNWAGCRKPNARQPRFAATLARTGWRWGPEILKVLGTPERALSPIAGFEAWRGLPQWEDEAPPAKPGSLPVEADEVRARLAQLVGMAARAAPNRATMPKPRPMLSRRASMRARRGSR